PGFAASGGFDGQIFRAVDELDTGGAPTGRVLVLGELNGGAYNGSPLGGQGVVARLDGSGAYDASFDSGAGPADSLGMDLIQEIDVTGFPTGRLLVAGGFQNGIVRLDADGDGDGVFNSNAGIGGTGEVRSVRQEL